MILFTSIFQSVFKRRDVKIFLSFSLLPILVPLLSKFMDGMKSDLTSNFLSFFDVAISTQFRFVLPVLLFSLVISSVFKEEIDSGIMFLYKDINRKKIFNAKVLSLLVLYGLFFVLTAILSLIAYYGIMLPQGQVLSHFSPAELAGLKTTLLSILATVCLNIITTILVSMVAIKAKTIQSTLVGVFFSLAASVAPMLIGIKYIFPNGYVNLEGTNFVISACLILLLSIIYISIFYLRGVKQFKNIEF